MLSESVGSGPWRDSARQFHLVSDVSGGPRHLRACGWSMHILRWCTQRAGSVVLAAGYGLWLLSKWAHRWDYLSVFLATSKAAPDELL